MLDKVNHQVHPFEPEITHNYKTQPSKLVSPQVPLSFEEEKTQILPCLQEGRDKNQQLN